MKINTVCIVEVWDNCAQRVTSFSNDPQGNLEAENYFIDIAREHGLSEKMIEASLNEGYMYIGSCGEPYSCYLVHTEA